MGSLFGHVGTLPCSVPAVCHRIYVVCQRSDSVCGLWTADAAQPGSLNCRYAATKMVPWPIGCTAGAGQVDLVLFPTAQVAGRSTTSAGMCTPMHGTGQVCAVHVRTAPYSCQHSAVLCNLQTSSRCYQLTDGPLQGLESYIVSARHPTDRHALQGQATFRLPPPRPSSHMLSLTHYFWLPSPKLLS